MEQASRSLRFASTGLAYGSAIASYALSLLLAKALAPEQFGQIVFAMSVGAFGVTLINRGTDFSLARDLSRCEDGLAAWGLLLRNLRRRFVVVPAIAVAAALLASLVPMTADNLLPTTLLVLWTSLQGAFLSAWYDYQGKTVVLNLILCSEKLLALGAVGALAAWARPNVLLGVAAAFFLLRLAALAVQLLAAGRPGVGAAAGEPPANLDGTSQQVLVALLLGGVIAQGNQVLLGAYGDSAGLAAYGIAIQTMSTVTIFQTQALRNLARDIAVACHDPHATSASLVRAARLVLLPSLVLVAGIGAFLVGLPWLLSDPAYAMIPGFALPLCTWVIVAGLGQVVTRHAMACGLDGGYVRATLVAAITWVCLGLYYIPKYGVVAAPWLLLACHSVSIALNTFSLFTFNAARKREVGHAS